VKTLNTKRIEKQAPGKEEVEKRGLSCRFIFTMTKKGGQGESLVAMPTYRGSSVRGRHKLRDWHAQNKVKDRSVVVKPKREDNRSIGVPTNVNIVWKDNVVAGDLNSVSFEKLKTKIERGVGTIIITVVVNGVDGSVRTQRGSSCRTRMVARMLWRITFGLGSADGGNRGMGTGMGQRGGGCRGMSRVRSRMNGTVKKSNEAAMPSTKTATKRGEGYHDEGLTQSTPPNSRGTLNSKRPLKEVLVVSTSQPNKISGWRPA